MLHQADAFVIDLIDDAMDIAVADGDIHRAMDLLSLKLTGSMQNNWTANQLALMREVAEDAAACLRAEGDHPKVVALLEEAIRCATEALTNREDKDACS